MYVFLKTQITNIAVISTQLFSFYQFIHTDILFIHAGVKYPYSMVKHYDSVIDTRICD